MLPILIDIQEGAVLAKRPITIGYVIFYILFLPDTWQAVMGLVAAYFVTPAIAPAQGAIATTVLLYIMIATIGYAGTRGPARGITHMLKKWTLGDRLL
jgi:hypothetical protein